jgi:hypothetical protein
MWRITFWSFFGVRKSPSHQVDNPGANYVAVGDLNVRIEGHHAAKEFADAESCRYAQSASG